MVEGVWREKAVRNEVVKKLRGLVHPCDTEGLNLLQLSSVVMTLGLKEMALKMINSKVPLCGTWYS